MANCTLAEIPVFYSHRMIADSDGSASPSTWKPRAVLQSWLSLGLPISVREFEPASPAILELAHDDAFVLGVLDGRRRNGFGNTNPEITATTPFTCGAMLAATMEALRNGSVACAPVSGFHHAGYDRAGGYCTFNGLMISANYLLSNKLAARIGILDADMHDGDGTQDIIDEFNLHDRIHHIAIGRDYTSPGQADGFFSALPDMLASFAGCDVVLYQAGADPHINDPLGGWLTTGQLAERDRIVFSSLRAMNIPVAWNLAGGYQRDKQNGISPVLNIHDNTMRACVEVWTQA